MKLITAFVAAVLLLAPAAARTMEEAMLDALIAKGAPGDAAVSIVGRVPTGIDPDTLDVAKLDYDASTGRFVAQIRTTSGRLYGLQGKVEAGLDVPVLNRALQTGDVVQAEDLEFIRMAQSRVQRGSITDSADLIGFSAKRQLRTATVLRIGDVQKPIVIRKGDAVTMVFSMPGIELTSRGKAMDNGGIGDTVAVVNTQSQKRIDAVVTGSGAVSVSPQGLATN